MKLDKGTVPSSIGLSAADSANLTIGNATDSTTGALKYIGAGDSTDRRFRLGLSGALDASGTGPVNFTPAAGMGMGWVGTGTHTLILKGTNTGNNVLNVIIVDTDDGLDPLTVYPTSLVKDGTGKWMSTINHTYKGDTTVLGGTLDLMDINTPDAAVSVAAGSNKLLASSIVCNTLTVGAGAEITIKPLPGGPLAGMGSLSAVPEPSTWAMLVLAAIGLGIYRRRSR